MPGTTSRPHASELPCNACQENTLPFCSYPCHISTWREWQFWELTVNLDSIFHLDLAPPCLPTCINLGRRGSWEPTIPSDIWWIGIKLLVAFFVDRGQVCEVNLVPQKTTDPSKSLHKLRTLLRFVRDEFEVRAKFFVLLSEPFQERPSFLRLLHLEPGRLVHKLLTVLFLLLAAVDYYLLCDYIDEQSQRQTIEREGEYLLRHCVRYIVWCPCFPKRWESRQHPTQAPSRCPQYQSSTFRYPGWSRQSIFGWVVSLAQIWRWPATPLQVRLPENQLIGLECFKQKSNRTHLIEAIFASVTDINDFDNLCY